MQAMAQYLWAYMTPWLKRAVKIVTSSAKAQVFEELPYLGVHIRRGDKITSKEAAYHSSEVNLRIFLNVSGNPPVTAQLI